MNEEQRQNLIIIALAVSLVAHAAIMFLMKPQVMSHIASGSDAAKRRNPMQVQEVAPPADAVRMDVVKDVEPARDSPEAESAADTLAPSLASIAAPASVEQIAAPELPPENFEMPQMPVVEVAPLMSEKIALESASAAHTTPIAENPARVSGAVAGACPDAPAAPPAPTDEAPLFNAPAFVPELAAPVISAPSEIAAVDEEEKPTEAFVPSAEVLPSVDERVVEQEKAAVRRLLDVKDAKDLSRVVALETASASEGEWLYFRIRFSPKADLEVVPKDVVVLLDASGSIGNDRMKSCRTAAQKILRSATNTGDRFNLVAFRDKFSYAFNTWQGCDRKSFDEADAWLGSLVVHGRTDVFRTIRSVLTLPRDPRRPLIAMVVTDGEANTGVSETSEILSRFTALNDGLISIYMYGVKSSANRELIDVLTHGNRGDSYVHTGDRWLAGGELETLSNRFRDPVLTDLRVVFAATSKAEAFPALLKNLYRGETVDVVGRVPKGQRKVSFSVRGLIAAESYESFFDIDLAGAGFDKTLPAAWRKEQTLDAKLHK